MKMPISFVAMGAMCACLQAGEFFGGLFWAVISVMLFHWAMEDNEKGD
jgi:hypothetical protein